MNICKAPFFFFFASSIFTSRQIAGSQGNAGRAGAEFSRAEPSLRSSAGWSLAGRRMRPPRRSETQPLSRRGRAAGRRGAEKCYEKPQKRPVG